MWQIFRELIWNSALGKVLAVIGTLELIYSLYVLVTPDVETLKLEHIDDRLWYGIAFLFLIATVLLALNVANKYKKRLEGDDNIRLVYNEKRYNACRVTEGDVEIIRVGFRVIGSKPISNPIIFPSHLFRIDSSIKHTKIPIISTPLTSLVPSHEVYSGLTPSYWVNVFTHKLGSNVIKLWYENYPTKLITLSTGEYKLYLIARGTPSKGDAGTLTINIDDNNILNIAFEGIDQWNTE